MRGVSSIGEAWRAAALRIGRLEARRLIEQVCGCSHADLIARPETPLTDAQLDLLDSLLARRLSGEPLAYLLGSALFCELEFIVSPAVLIPRPETELLVELAAQCAQDFDEPRIVDLGTGSGIVAIMLARLCPFAVLSAVDLSPEALGVARLNAERHAPQVRFLAGDWFAPLGDERFEIIVANPPYVVYGDPHLEADGLPFEPQIALTDGIAGGDGLSCIRRIVAGARTHLVPEGHLLIEHGYDQADNVQGLLLAHGFAEVRTWQDLAGIDRVTGGKKY